MYDAASNKHLPPLLFSLFWPQCLVWIFIIFIIVWTFVIDKVFYWLKWSGRKYDAASNKHLPPLLFSLFWPQCLVWIFIIFIIVWTFVIDKVFYWLKWSGRKYDAASNKHLPPLFSLFWPQSTNLGRKFQFGTASAQSVKYEVLTFFGLLIPRDSGC